MKPRPRVWAFEGITPVVHPTAFVHATAVLIGDAIVGPGCYVGPHASMRGDMGRVVLEAGANLQDGCVMHSFPGHDAIVEKDGHVGHGAILHGCRVGRNALIGMNAVIMDGALIGEDSIVAAMAFVKAGQIIPPRSLVVGMPARVIRPVSDEELGWKTEGTSIYQALAARCLASLEECEALTETEPGRPSLNTPDLQPLFAFRKNTEQT